MSYPFRIPYIGNWQHSFFWIAFFSLAYGQSLVPEKNWRFPTEIKTASGNFHSLRNLSRSKSSTWEPGGKGTVWFTWTHEENKAASALLTYSVHPFTTGIVEYSTTSRPGIWVPLDSLDPGPFLNKLEYISYPGYLYRIQFFREGKKKIKIWNLGFYQPQQVKRNDYWLGLGASIQNQSLRQACFSPAVKRVFPTADPILFNMAVKGWGTGDLNRAIPAILENHPHSTYVLLHIGGNDVTRARPFPGGANELFESLERLLETLAEAGKIPIFSRLSYRRYDSPYAVPPDSNGSGPYVESIYDPLIAIYSPDFYHHSEKKGSVDFYQLIQRNQRYLSQDGIHLNSRGEKKWCDYWAEKVAPLVYSEKRQAEYIGSKFLLAEVSKSSGIIFHIKNQRHIKEPSALIIYNRQKERIKTMDNLGSLSAGKIVWNLKDAKGLMVKPGTYHFELSLRPKKYIGKIVLFP